MERAASQGLLSSISENNFGPGLTIVWIVNIIMRNMKRDLETKHALNARFAIRIAPETRDLRKGCRHGLRFAKSYDNITLCTPRIAPLLSGALRYMNITRARANKVAHGA